jgi:hypothetical protein
LLAYALLLGAGALALGSSTPGRTDDEQLLLLVVVVGAVAIAVLVVLGSVRRVTNPATWAAVCIAIAMTAVVIAASTLADADDFQYGPQEGLERARQFDPFHVYFAGDEISNLPLEAVLGGPDVRNATWSFIYGDCQAPCAAPLEVQTWSTCRRYRDIYSFRNRSFPFRGAQASRHGGGTFEIYSARVTIVIFGAPEAARVAAQAVRRVSDQTPRHLAPPAKGSLNGDLPCQRGH